MKRKIEVSQINNGFLVKIENGSIQTSDKNDPMSQFSGIFGTVIEKMNKDKGDIPDTKKSISDGIYYCETIEKVNGLIQLAYED